MNFHLNAFTTKFFPLFKFLFSLTLLIFFFSAFAPHTYASAGTFNASNFSYDPISHQLSFTADTFSFSFNAPIAVGISSSNGTRDLSNAFSCNTSVAYASTMDFSCTLSQGNFRPNDGNTVYAFILTNNSGTNDLFSQSLTIDSPQTENPPLISQINDQTINQMDVYSATGSFTDPDSTSWTATVDYDDGSHTIAQPLNLNGTNFTLSHQYKTAGTHTIYIYVTDNQGLTGTSTAIVQANRINEGSFNASNVSYDPLSHNLSFTADGFSFPFDTTLAIGLSSVNLRDQVSLNTQFSCNTSFVYAPSMNFSCMLSQGNFRPNTGDTVYLKIFTNEGVGVNYLFSQAVTLTPPANDPPIINTLHNTTINEGDSYSVSGSFADPDSTSWTATVDYGDGSGSQALTLSGTNFSLSHVYKDNGTYTVTVSVTDNQGATGTGTATVTVNNVAPSLGTITAPTSPVQVNTAIAASATFTDPGVLDTHTASWNWGDGNTTTGTVTETNGSGSVSNNHTYTATGVYTITLTVTDKDGGAGTSTYQYIAVYDSNTSFAGGRSFDNPSSASPSTSGKVTFGVSAKYNRSNVLTGDAKMKFKAANLDFVSTSLSSLATSNGKAYLKGSGTLNGSSGYTFLATGVDGSVAGGTDMIRFQIKDSANNVVYDSQPGAGDTANPTTTDATGNIRVH